ncbi:thermonuclease family protein [Escherichia coli]|uniref:thermonuclease family protein n=1 Tax=Escherichia coli TaxID=562 RepID=UPI0017F62738|nr:nuclease [Escherichia coli]EFF9539378.1 nuclease [Escherichia coli]EFM6597290.1 nuclease [Escherichia coli]EKT0191505.1 thermonuclease family protein [Escherichia coli]MDD8641919.1 thermonuclease family protein [Escherichia coli]
MGLLKKLLLPTLFVLLPTVSLAAQPSFEAKVVKIIDGDTITALDNQNTSIKIRLYGIDAPESKQAFGQKSKQALSSAIAAQNITVVDHGPDIYGRTLGTIWLDGYDINASMVDSGYAWVYRFDGKAIVPNYLKFESSAQKTVQGLWIDPNPIAPWEWRQQYQKHQKTKNRG